jgi:uncharacterized protein YkwD
MIFPTTFRARTARTFCGLVVLALLRTASTTHAQVPDDAHRIFDLTNQDRQEHGLPALHWDATLAQAAQAHADRMVGERTLSHQYADEPELTERAASAGAHFRAIAENIATGPNPPAIENEWIHSPSHRANILDPKMDALGVAVVKHGGNLYAVEDFEQSSQQLTKKQVELRVQELLRARGVDASAAAGPAEEACASGRGIPQGTNARSMVGFETPDLSQLPAQVVDVIRNKDFRKAAVGACAPGSKQADFTTYRVAILFY